MGNVNLFRNLKRHTHQFPSRCECQHGPTTLVQSPVRVFRFQPTGRERPAGRGGGGRERDRICKGEGRPGRGRRERGRKTEIARAREEGREDESERWTVGSTEGGRKAGRESERADEVSACVRACNSGLGEDGGGQVLMMFDVGCSNYWLCDDGIIK